jgi:predicted transcriptional regulator
MLFFFNSLEKLKGKMVALSRIETKELVFDTLAEYFESTGQTTCVTVDEIVKKTDIRIRRIQSLFDEMVKEDVIYQGCEEEGYRLTGSAYMMLCMSLEDAGRLPKGVEMEYGSFDEEESD